MVDDLENSRHPVFKEINSLGRGFLKKKKGKDTIHFNGEHSNIDLLYRTVHSANQLSTHGAVTKRCETQSRTDSGKKTHYGSESARRKSREIDMKREELKSLVDIPKLPNALGNRMLQNVDNFESMSRGGQIEFLRTPAGFYHTVQVGRIFTTIRQKDDGWRRCTSLSKEYTKLRKDKDSRPYPSIDAYQQIGPVLNIVIAKVLDVCGIEVQVPPLSNPKDSTWTLISRVHEKFVNELHLQNDTIVNHSSSLLRREENSDQVNQDSDKPAFGKPMQGSEDSDGVVMREKHSTQLRETVASTISWVIQASSRETAASWNDSELVSIHSRTESDRRDKNLQTDTKKEIPMKDRIWTTIPGFLNDNKKIH